MIKKIVTLSIFFGLIFSLYTLMKINFYSDLSILPVQSIDLNPSKPIYRTPVYLVSYADGTEVFFKNQHALAASALNRGIDFIYNYRRSLLNPTFVEKNKHTLDQKRGSGYWLWKPYVILKTLESMPENALMVYADTGFTFRKHIQPLLDQLQDTDILLVRWFTEPNYIAENIIKRDVLIRMNCDTLACRQGPHIWAGFLVLRNTDASRKFIQQWLDYCCDEALLTDIPSQMPEYKNFHNHHHDQAILTALYNLNPQGKKLLAAKDLALYAPWHHRHPGAEYKSLLHHMSDKIRSYERIFINSKPIILMRQFLIEKFYLKKTNKDE